MPRFILIPILAIVACSPPESSEVERDTPEPPAAASEIPVAEASAIDESQTEQAPSLQQVWLTSGFSAPEGVSSYGNELYISNVAGEGGDKDGEGWISRLAMDGTVLEERWIDGLNAPKGMAEWRGKLYVSDIDAYHVIDIASARIENTYPIEGATFMNDIVYRNSMVLGSDSGTGQIFHLDENGYKLWLADDKLAGANGLTAFGDSVLIATMDSGSLFQTYNLGDLYEIATGMDNADGIAVLDDRSFLVSSWPGQIWHVTEDGETTEILNTVDEGIYQNDLTRVGDLIIVPNWQPGTVTAWRVVD
ncbi:MAG: hypothetical protein AAGB16_04315 [Pseudomonadota bacterium]